MAVENEGGDQGSDGECVNIGPSRCVSWFLDESKEIKAVM